MMDPNDYALRSAKKLHHEWVRTIRASTWATENGAVCQDLEFDFGYGDGYTGEGSIKLTVPSTFGWVRVHLRLSSNKAGDLQGTPVIKKDPEPEEDWDQTEDDVAF